MILIKKLNNALSIFKTKRGGIVIRVENFVSAGCSIKSSIVLSQKEFDELLENGDKMLEVIENDEVENHEHGE